MRAIVWVLLVCVTALLTATSSQADDVVGAIWHVERKDGIKWQFRAGPKGVIWTVPKDGKPEPLGTWSGNPGKTVMKFDGTSNAKIGVKRTITIVLVGKNPPMWQGEVEFPNGDKFPLTVTLIKD